jgi:hypothetical protein
MKDYKLIATRDMVDFQESVRAALAEGWELQGGVAIGLTHYPQDNNSLRFHFAQALIRDKKEEPDR